MSIDSVFEQRRINGYEITVKARGPMGIVASNVRAKEVRKVLDFIEEKMRDYKK